MLNYQISSIADATRLAWQMPHQRLPCHPSEASLHCSRELKLAKRAMFCDGQHPNRGNRSLKAVDHEPPPAGQEISHVRPSLAHPSLQIQLAKFHSVAGSKCLKLASAAPKAVQHHINAPASVCFSFISKRRGTGSKTPRRLAPTIQPVWPYWPWQDARAAA